MSDKPLELAMDLIRRESVTPADAGCQEVIADRLEQAGFSVEKMPMGGVSNIWCKRGAASPTLTFAGHTDVVPVGNLDRWTTPPFEPTIRDGWLYGRGAADMKSSVAAMVVAAERFVAEHSNHRGSIAFLLTSDEEGPAQHGTQHVMRQLQERDELFDWCIVGEPSSLQTLGDTIRVGRRGSLSGELTIEGAIGHVAYPELTPNVVHSALSILDKLASRQWDEGNEAFPPTTFQISNVNAGTGAANVIPGEINVLFNFRFNTEQSPDLLKKTVSDELATIGKEFRFDIDWHVSGLPFLSHRGEFMKTVFDEVHRVTNAHPVPSTSGGTSDARFIVPNGIETVELGPVNATIHKYNERVSIGELDTLATVFERILERLLA